MVNHTVYMHGIHVEHVYTFFVQYIYTAFIHIHNAQLIGWITGSTVSTYMLHMCLHLLITSTHVYMSLCPTKFLYTHIDNVGVCMYIDIYIHRYCIFQFMDEHVLIRARGMLAIIVFTYILYTCYHSSTVPNISIFSLWWLNIAIEIGNT